MLLAACMYDVRLSGWGGSVFAGMRPVKNKNAETTTRQRGASRRQVSVVSGSLPYMTTTPHPIVGEADTLLESAATLVQNYWQRRDEGHTPYGIPEALLAASQLTAQSPVALILAERQCVTYGLDVWWNDLLCVDGDDAACELRKLKGIQPKELYGDMWAANLALLELATTLTPDLLNGLSNQINAAHRTAIEQCMPLARDYERGRILMNLCEDVHFAVPHQEGSPAAVQRRLNGIRALEMVAIHHVLYDRLPVSMRNLLLGPVMRMMLPLELTEG